MYEPSITMFTAASYGLYVVVSSGVCRKIDVGFTIL